VARVGRPRIYHDAIHEKWRKMSRTYEFNRKYLKQDREYVCAVCGERITKLKGKDKDSICFHHSNDDHGDNRLSNRESMHFGCHTRISCQQGSGFSGRKHTKESKRKMSKSLKKSWEMRRLLSPTNTSLRIPFNP